MNDLNRAARCYLFAIWGISIVVLVILLPYTATSVSLLWFMLWIAGYAAADYFEVNFEIGDNTIGMTLAETITIFLVATGETTSVFVIVAGTTIVEIIRRRRWYKAAFNIATRVITVGIMIGLYQLLHVAGTPAFSDPKEIVTFLVIAGAFYLSSAIIIGIMVALATHSPVRQVYKESYQLVQWIHLLTLPIGALMAAHWATNRWLLIFDVLVLLIAQRSFVMVAQLQTESQRRKELADERERLLLELQAQQEELIRASKLAALGTFSAGIAHEFNNLLTVILGQSQIGLVTDDPAEMRESLERTTNASRRGRSITQGLLTFARQGESQRIMTRLEEVVSDTVGMVEHDFAQERIQIVCHLDAVPATSCDPGQILQVLLNLLTNARDAMRELGGGVISLFLHHEANQIILTISDTGGGIPPEVQDQLFQPFVTTKGNKGTGLGLAICYGIIESHNGSIHVESTIGVGTTFTIRLPIIDHYEPAIHMSQADELRFAAATSSEPIRIYS